MFARFVFVFVFYFFKERIFFFRLFVVGNVSVFSRFFLSFSRE